MKTYQIVTDATADLTQDVVQALGIDVIPMEYDIDGEVHTFAPGGSDISLETFYSQLRDGRQAHTSQINPLVYKEHFERYLAQGMDVLYICFSSGLSATIQGAHTCIQKLQEKYPDRRIYCVDSLCASSGEGFFVYSAKKKQDEGMEIEELNQWLNDHRLNVCHWFTVDDLGHLRRGGRISSATAIMGTALQIKPILHVDEEGHLINMFKVRGRKKSLSGLMEHMSQTWTPELGTEVFIGHGDCPADADYLASLIRDKHPQAQVSIFPIGPIIGAHAGPGVVALFFWGSSR
ncbi:DegV family protein [Anaerolentibacter hominis]|uniref:DegV family protein n=1 Tax=Anaerolentibacter hominis TaxID=3079009 RepID=UPI0031B85FE8